MGRLKDLFEELESEIKKENHYQRCPDYYNDCVQCEFWVAFDTMKHNLLELEKKCQDDAKSVTGDSK